MLLPGWHFQKTGTPYRLDSYSSATVSVVLRVFNFQQPVERRSYPGGRLCLVEKEGMESEMGY